VKTRVYLATSLALLLGGAGFALERGMALAATREARATAFAELEDALALAARHPGAFGTTAPEQAGLKALAQDLATKRGLAIGFLSESERENERHVAVRLVHPAHRNLVLFLGDLEARAGRVREIHVRPSTSKADHYEEAEIVVARVSE
jgi:hypothetical protein